MHTECEKAGSLKFNIHTFSLEKGVNDDIRVSGKKNLTFEPKTRYQNNQPL
jgi:hypothetical protein